MVIAESRLVGIEVVRGTCPKCLKTCELSDMSSGTVMGRWKQRCSDCWAEYWGEED